MFCDKVIEAGWLVAILVVPLFFNDYSEQIFEPDKLALLRSIALVMGLAWLVRRLELGRVSPETGVSSEAHEACAARPFWRNPPVLGAVLLLAVTVLASGFSVVPRFSLWGNYDTSQGAYTTFALVLVFLLLTDRLRTAAQVSRLLTVVVVTSCPVVLYAIIQQMGRDPRPWPGGVGERPFSTLGNPIFLGAYLAMVIPVTLGWALSTRRRLREAGAGHLWRWIAAGSSLLLVLCQGAALVLSQSRGPLVGLCAGLFAFVLIAAAVRGKRKLALGALGFAIALVAFVAVLNLPEGPLAKWRSFPYLDRLGNLFEGRSETVRVRVLIWEAVDELVRSTPERLLAGWGPESQLYTLARHAPAELGQYEGSGHISRTHNELFDALVTTGLGGVCTLIFLWASLFFLGLRGLKLIEGPRERIGFWVAVLGGSILGAAVPWIADGQWRFCGLGVSLGLAGGVFSYLVYRSVLRRRRIEEADGQRDDFMILAAVLSGLVAHFVEVSVGLAVATARTYFWVYAALVVVLSSRRFLAKETHPVLPPPKPHKKEKSRVGQPLAPSAVRQLLPGAILLGLLLQVVLWDFFHALPSKGPGTFGWAAAGISGLLSAIMMASQARLAQTANRDGIPLGIFVVVSAGLLIAFVPLFQWATEPVRDPAEDPSRVVLFVGGWLAAILVLVAAGLWRPTPRPVPFFRGTRSWGALAALVALLLWVGRAELDPLRADVHFHIARALFQKGVWDGSIDFYNRAVALAPTQDRYFIFLGEVYGRKAGLVRPGRERDDLLAKAVEYMEKARELSPRSSDHIRNLGRVYLYWADNTGDPARRQECLQKAEEHYREATTLRPHFAESHSEWGYVAELRQDFTEAEKRMTHAVELNPKFAQGYLRLGRLYQKLGRGQEAIREARLALEVAPAEERPALEAFVRELER